MHLRRKRVQQQQPLIFQSLRHIIRAIFYYVDWCLHSKSIDAVCHNFPLINRLLLLNKNTISVELFSVLQRHSVRNNWSESFVVFLLRKWRIIQSFTIVSSERVCRWTTNVFCYALIDLRDLFVLYTCIVPFIVSSVFSPSKTAFVFIKMKFGDRRFCIIHIIRSMWKRWVEFSNRMKTNSRPMIHYLISIKKIVSSIGSNSLFGVWFRWNFIAKNTVCTLVETKIRRATHRK